eukprot:TRINITY_DN25152_c0_g1_i1.p1 TRINITY_DN25152_c0_g1~~TRINITY_DN25152_c0_g1_i1.p1  ORF type:complete len:175 (-),score=9.48 TRINITY_DN25152_c0_g1_i1:205-729(-)
MSGRALKNLVITVLGPSVLLLSIGILLLWWSTSGTIGKCFTADGEVSKEIVERSGDAHVCHITHVSFAASDGKGEACGRFFNGLDCGSPLAELAKGAFLDCQLSGSLYYGKVCQGGGQSVFGWVVGLLLTIFGACWLALGLGVRCAKATSSASYVNDTLDDNTPATPVGRTGGI